MAKRWPNHSSARYEIHRGVFYKQQRLHSGLGYKTPLEAHNEYVNGQLAARISHEKAARKRGQVSLGRDVLGLHPQHFVLIGRLLGLPLNQLTLLAQQGLLRSQALILACDHLTQTSDDDVRIGHE